MNRRIRYVAVGALLLLAVGMAAAARWARTDGRSGSTLTLESEDFRVLVEATGKLEAAVSYEVGPPSVREFWEYDLTWMIPEGKQVQKGDVVARFDTTELDDRLRDYRAELETTIEEREKEERNLEVSLRQLRLDLVKAEGELKKVELDLSVPEALVSSIELQQNRLKQDLARRRVAFLSEKIEFEKVLVESKLALLDVKRQLFEGKIEYNEEAKRKFEVPAPVAGLVIYMPKRNGDRWEVGEGVWMLAKILEVADVSTLRVVANVLEVDSARIAPGQRGTITVDAVPGLRLESEVSEIGRIVHERSIQDPSKVFDAILPLAGVATDDLRPGMSTKVEIVTEVLPDRLSVPLTAIGRSADGPWVEVLADGSTERRIVELGRRNGDRVVVESGLVSGEIVRLTSRGSSS
jgi:HlyD family secretion protein